MPFKNLKERANLLKMAQHFNDSYSQLTRVLLDRLCDLLNFRFNFNIADLEKQIDDLPSEMSYEARKEMATKLLQSKTDDSYSQGASSQQNVNEISWILWLLKRSRGSIVREEASL